MRIELFVRDAGNKRKDAVFLGFTFTDASPDLHRCFSARFWEAGAVRKARIFSLGTGWKNVTREELEKLLTVGEDEDQRELRQRLEAMDTPTGPGDEEEAGQ